MSTQPKPRRLPPQPHSNPALAAALSRSATSGSPAGVSGGTPAVSSAPGQASTPANAQATPAEPSSTPAPAGAAETAFSQPDSAPTAPGTVTDHPTAPADDHDPERKVFLGEEVDRLGLAFKTTLIRAGDIMRFQSHVRRLNVTQYVPRVPYVLSSSLAQEVERFDEACDQIEAALLKAYGTIYAEIERRKAAERAALSPPPPHLPSRAATTPPPALAGSALLPSQPASPRPTTAHDRPHPPPLNTRLTDIFPQRPSAFPRPSAVHLSALPNAALSLSLSTASASGSSEPYPPPPPSSGRHLNHPGLSLDLSATKLFGVQPDSLASPVTLAPKRGGQQSPTSDAAGLLPPELISALQGVGGLDLSALQNLQNMQNMPSLQNLQNLQGPQAQSQALQMSPASMALHLQLSPQQHQQMLLPGLGLMSPAHIEQGGDMDMDYLDAPAGEGTRPGTGGQAGADGERPSTMDGMDIDFLDVPGPVRPPAPNGEGAQAAVGGSRPATAGAQAEGEQKHTDVEGDQAMGDMLVSLGAAQGEGAVPSNANAALDGAVGATAASEQAASGTHGDMSALGGMDFNINIPGLDDPDFLNTFTKPSSPSALSGLGPGGGGEMDFGSFDLGELPELNFGASAGEQADGGLDFASMDGLGALGGMGVGVADGAGMGDLDFGAMGDMGMDMDFGELGDMLGAGAGAGGEQAGAGQPGDAPKPQGAVLGGSGKVGDSSAMDDDGMIDLDGGLDLDELFKNFGGEEGEES
ncbi:hypothetical protein CALVIDRAFT_580949 [Calocera viscosa TUFC12733]|uniref:Uncharacterized protein n=1 Tax=Calocera viscosa (strain TUFC12733) TaxID=1330018 RepID=A0A167RJ68_CALVF|nr:hypothetical protein CALVIDRAFT_580949 [Calocera viscosa TUFC12733]